MAASEVSLAKGAFSYSSSPLHFSASFGLPPAVRFAFSLCPLD
jgi:hypothetical protein